MKRIITISLIVVSSAAIAIAAVLFLSPNTHPASIETAKLIGTPLQTGSTTWPSLQEQMAHDHVIPGSALAKLIAENQDFSLLDPSEARDWPSGIPLWIRVWYRKQGHPNGVQYLDSLGQIYTWMLEHQDLPPPFKEWALY